jgi:hypothetical protein
MTYEEMAIMTLLRGSPSVYLARREIARKALKRSVFEENPHWADAPLVSLVDQSLVEQDESGHHKIKRDEDSPSRGNAAQPAKTL